MGGERGGGARGRNAERRCGGMLYRFANGCCVPPHPSRCGSTPSSAWANSARLGFYLLIDHANERQQKTSCRSQEVLWNDSKSDTIPGYRFAIALSFYIGCIWVQNRCGWVQNWLGGCNTELSFCHQLFNTVSLQSCQYPSGELQHQSRPLPARSHALLR